MRRVVGSLLGIVSLLLLATFARSQSVSREVLPIGRSKQLLIDDYVIASTENLTRVMHRPRRHPNNPILTGTEPWERWMIEVDGRPVIYDEEAGEFKMYYVAPLSDPAAPTGTRYKTCLAISKDGIHWRRPELGQVEWEGTSRNNILRWGENWMRRPNVIRDPQDPDPNRRFKMTYVDVIGGETAITKGYSKDGIVWRLNGDGRPWFRRSHNSNLLGWDPRIREYVIFPRMPGSPNSVGRATSKDFVDWSEPQTVLAPEPADEGKDFKGNAAFLYGGIYLGLLWVFDRLQTAETELTFSRDGVSWQRPFRGEYLFPRGEAGAWDSSMVLPNAPVIYRDEIRIYYAGWNMPYTAEANKRAEEGWIENGVRRQRAIGLAVLRLDGFVSLRAGDHPGILTTKSLEIEGGSLSVNADIRKEMTVEVLDEKGEPIAGYTAADCRPIRADGVRQTVRWKGRSSLDALRGRAVKLRFLIRDGDLYSFQITPASGR